MPDLEQRVKRLEGELSILKNQIQMTLLEVQAGLSSHYYPELRSESVRSNQRFEQDRPVQPAPPVEPSASAANSDVIDEPPAPAQADVDPSSPVRLKKISLDELHKGNGPEAPMPSQENQIVDHLSAVASLEAPEDDAIEHDLPLTTSPIETTTDTDPALTADVIHWAVEAVNVLGKEQTRKVIALCFQDGRIDQRLADQLGAMLDLGSNWEPDEKPSFDVVLTTMMDLVEITDTH